MSTNPLVTDQPPPERNGRPASWDLVVQDMRDRHAHGLAKYGTPLQPGNGRDSLVDAYQEALDLAVYLRNEIEERRLLADRLTEAARCLRDPSLTLYRRLELAEREIVKAMALLGASAL
jgi:hypothetical protein